MRVLTTTFVTLGLAGFFAAGCSSSTTGDGGTTGGSTTSGTTTGGVSATTSGGTSGTATGGTTGTTTTGGTTGAPGSACSGNAACSSNLCLGSVCCASSSCAADTGCDATSCDGTGACVYPSGTACGASTCSGSSLTASACDSSGTCAAGTPLPCAGNLVCADATSCLTQCTGKADCVDGFYCSGGSCVPLQGDGSACSTNVACASGVCGIGGTGNCCHTSCDTTDPTCGATACDNTGACTFPDATTACGVDSCSGSTLTSSACNAAGACVSNGGAPCPSNLACADAVSCFTSCVSGNAACATGAFCEPSTNLCCPGIASGSTLAIDSVTGQDSNACCGYGTAGACGTLTHAMSLVNGTNAVNPGTLVTLSATVNAVGGDWTGESYPVALSWGVTLKAPGVYFTDQNGNGIFDVKLGDGEVAGNPVTIGVPSVNAPDQVVIGADSTATLTSDPVTITVEASETLNLLNAQVYEASGSPVCVFFPCGSGVTVQASAVLNLGFDQNGNSGTVYLGGPNPNGNAPAYDGFFSTPSTGILCNGTVTDDPSGATPSLVAQAQAPSIDAEDNCLVTLNNSPQFGTPTGGDYTYNGSGNGCATSPPPDAVAIMANGDGAQVTLSGAQITCMSFYGIEVTYSNNAQLAGPPVVTATKTQIENCGQAGVFANAGTVNLVGATLTHNFIGVQMSTDTSNNINPTVNLNDGTGNPPFSSVTCSSNQEDTFQSGNPGIDVYNNSAGSLGADNVNWDQWYYPNGDTAVAQTTDVFYCDNSFSCTCQSLDSSSSPGCITTAGADDMDLVLGTGGGSSPTGSWSEANGAKSPNACN